MNYFRAKFVISLWLRMAFGFWLCSFG